MHKSGDLQVWWIPQVPMDTLFTVDVSSVTEAAKLLNVLADYDIFQFEQKIKPDYSNAGGLRQWCLDNEDGPGWEDWCDPETGEDDPIQWLENQERT